MLHPRQLILTDAADGRIGQQRTHPAQRDTGVLSDPGSKARLTAIGLLKECLKDFTGYTLREQALESTITQKSGEGGAKMEERDVPQSFDASPLGRAWLRRCVSVARGPWLGATERNL